MSNEAYQKLFAAVKLLVVLSYGQSSVERGFSVNKETSVDNVSPRTVIAKRVVCDHINAVGGVLKVALTKELLHSASLSRRKYEQLNCETLLTGRSFNPSLKQKILDAF